MRRGLVGLAWPRTRPRTLAAAIDDDFVVLRGGDGGRGGVECGGRRGLVVGAPLPPLPLGGPLPLRGLQAVGRHTFFLKINMNLPSFEKVCPLSNFSPLFDPLA